jgi:hypothetical protein
MIIRINLKPINFSSLTLTFTQKKFVGSKNDEFTGAMSYYTRYKYRSSDQINL